ncbi:DUF2460 domain-containing protein, partial [uncultured Amaricoccus sp.]|uniref:DUF2460 domain-containing protein n=1 Tax=uncultured Amaricoccus sp. TaxID=339341 RepID=UPI00260497B4
YGLRWKVWTDFKSCAPSAAPAATDQRIGTGDGAAKAFDLGKAYRSGAQSYLRPIRKPVEGTVRVAVSGVTLAAGAFTVDVTVGRVFLTAAPADGAPVTAGFEFDVPVRFDSDRITTSLAGFAAGEVPSIPVIEVRV